MNEVEIAINCPFCNDKKRHLYINIKKGIGYCFKCHATPKLTDVISKLDVNDVITKIPDKDTILFNPPGDMLIDSLVSNSPSNAAKIAFNYLTSRGLTVPDILQYRIRFSVNKHVIVWFPIFGVDTDTPLYYQGRTVGKNGNYIFQKGNLFSFIPFRSWCPGKLTERADTAVIVEGIFDAISVGKIMPAVALLGKNANNAKIKYLKRLANNWIIWLDADAANDSVLLALKIKKLLPDSSVKIVPDSMNITCDPDECCAEVQRDVLTNAKAI